MFFQRNLYLIPLFIAAAIAVYCYNPFALYFQNDDFLHIQLSREGVLFQRNTFRPVCDLSVILDYYLWGKRAEGYHVTNLVLHFACTILVYFFSKQVTEIFFSDTNKKFIAFISAFLFFVYPFHSEAVFWILGRSAILGAIFSLLFLQCYLSKSRSLLIKIACILFYVVALLTYESSWILPVFCVLLYFITNKNQQANNIISPVTIILLFCVYLFVRWKVTNELIGNYEGGNFLNGNIKTLILNYAKLILRSLLLPFNNNIFFIFFALLTLLIIYSFFRLPNRDKKKIIVLFIFFVSSLLPYTSLGIDTHGTEGERFLYMPSILVCITFSILFLNANIETLLKSFILFFYVTFSILILNKNTNNYRLAGKVTRTFVKEVSKLKNKHALYIEGLPQSQNGALILREGLIESVNWFKQTSGIDTVIICSKRDELLPLIIPYYLKYNSSTTAVTVCNKYFQIERDAVFCFTDSALIIAK